MTELELNSIRHASRVEVICGAGGSLYLILNSILSHISQEPYGKQDIISIWCTNRKKRDFLTSQYFVARKVKDFEQISQFRVISLGVMKKPGMKVTQEKLWKKIITELEGIWRAYLEQDMQIINPWAKILPATCELIMILFETNTEEHTVLQACHSCYHLDIRA